LKNSEIKLPSNKNFGLLFSAIFFLIALYFLYNHSNTIAYVLIGISIIFLIITLYNSDLLFPLNKLWMRFGFLLGIVISPVVLGIIFFGLFSPYGIIMRIFGRDELHLKKIKRKTYWKPRLNELSQTNFKRQF